MDVEISPEPTAPEREAVTQALERLLDPVPGDRKALYDSPWRLAGLRENATHPSIASG